MKSITFFLLLIATSLVSQSEFAPIGATWKFLHSSPSGAFQYDCDYNVCQQEKGSFAITGTSLIDGKAVSILQMIDVESNEAIGDSIYLHSNNDKVYFYDEGEFHLLYDFTAEAGDTLLISLPTSYVGFGFYNGSFQDDVDPIIHITVLVEDGGTVLVDGEMREVKDYYGINLDEDSNSYTLPRIIDGIGSGEAFFGYVGGFLAHGCFGRFLCYEDNNQSYTPFGCCDFPEDYPPRSVAPLGAEWLYEGWSDGTQGTGCESYCTGNYNMFKVVDEIEIGGRVHAVIHRYHRTAYSDWEETDDVIYMYDLEGDYYAHAGSNQFTRTYTTNLDIGDTIQSAAVYTYPKWIGIEEEYEFPAIGGLQVVTSVEDININGQSRKKITFNALSDYGLGIVIEGIGPLTHGLLGSTYPIPTSGCGPRLLCYRDSLISFTTQEECNCEFPMNTDAVSDETKSSIYLFPNPVHQKLTIDNQSNIDIHSVKVYSIKGTLLLHQEYVNEIDVSMLLPGMYMLDIVSEAGSIVKKFIKV